METVPAALGGQSGNTVCGVQATGLRRQAQVSRRGQRNVNACTSWIPGPSCRTSWDSAALLCLQARGLAELVGV